MARDNSDSPEASETVVLVIKGMNGDGVSTILFDFFGTIAVYEDLTTANSEVVDIVFRAFQQAGARVRRREFENVWHDVMPRAVKRREQVRGSAFVRKIMESAEGCALDLDAERAEAVALRCLASWQGHISFPPEVHDVLRALQSTYTLGIVSNFDHPAHLHNVLDVEKLRRYFSVVVISAEVGVWKPDPRIFRTALRAVGSRADRTVFVGDSIREDVAGAVEVGCVPILMDRNEEHPEFAGFRVRTFRELLEMLDPLRGR